MARSVSGVPEANLYEAVGGMPFFERLVDGFYDGVVADDVLAPLYPTDDIDGARHRLTLFLAQYWGGPTTYSEERGHPRLRMRHMPFHIGPLERDHWLGHMTAAIEVACSHRDVPDGIDEVLLGYFIPTAENMRNDTGLPISTSGHRGRP